MSKLILKAIPANATNATADQTLGYIDTTGSTQRVSVKAQPKTVYRLVDAKTGEVIKNQTVLRQGKHLLVTVDGVNAVDLDNFFPDDAANATAPVDSPSYLVDRHMRLLNRLGHLLCQFFQNVTVFPHDFFGSIHLGSELGAIRGEVRPPLRLIRLFSTAVLALQALTCY